MQTKIGARLDSWADLGTYALSFLAIYIFKWNEIKPHAILFWVFAVVLALSYLQMFIKFKGLIGLHTYMFKITGYIQGACIISLFVWGFTLWQYYFSISWGILACIEEMIIISLLSMPQSDVKGLYWVLKKRTAG
jgi:CDP-diacylglycerol--glycerol-3-phosphate 3-phosphatidyltransferase